MLITILNALFLLSKKEECFVKNIGGIACNMEIYKSINTNNFTIIDSYAHLTSSLDTLIKNNEEEFNLIKKKGFYPYEMIQVPKCYTYLSES
jgi:hypothetical protein